ncbi:MAG: hypothetical protein E7411_00945 [Ruminococcaceae bacterium]|nr:hypothetical protein [Oscillospiraceae bacterium]
MKKIIISILLLSLCLTGCMTVTEIPEEPDVNVPQKEENVLPKDSKLGNIVFSVEEISEALYVEFEDNKTKVTLSNSDGKYYLVSYTFENKESFDIDIDHSVEILLIDEKDEVYMGEYYENKTGKENITVKSGEKVNALFVSDMPVDTKIKTVIFRYLDKKYEYSVK